jgi:PleD family two-component response regulator
LAVSATSARSYQVVTAERRPAPRAADRSGTETILVVDDRADVADTAKVILEDFGYTVLVAHDARASVRSIEASA